MRSRCGPPVVLASKARYTVPEDRPLGRPVERQGGAATDQYPVRLVVGAGQLLTGDRVPGHHDAMPGGLRVTRTTDRPDEPYDGRVAVGSRDSQVLQGMRQHPRYCPQWTAVEP